MSELIQNGVNFSLRGEFEIVVNTEKFKESWPNGRDFQRYMGGRVLNFQQNDSETTFVLSEITEHSAFDMLKMDASIKPVPGIS